MGIGGGGYGYGGSYQGGYGQPMMRGAFGGMRGGMGRGFGSVVNPMMMRGGFNPGMVRSDKHHALIPELLSIAQKIALNKKLQNLINHFRLPTPQKSKTMFTCEFFGNQNRQVSLMLGTSPVFAN